MARQITITNINNTTGEVTFNVTYDTLSKTFTVSRLPLDTKANLVEAIKSHLRAYIAGKRAEKITPPSDEVTAMVNVAETVDVGEA